LQRLKDKVLRTTGNLTRHAMTREMHVAFNVPYVYEFITQQAKVTHYQANETAC
jgi:hypothetical protein